jgi:hypothetical protein
VLNFGLASAGAPMAIRTNPYRRDSSRPTRREAAIAMKGTTRKFISAAEIVSRTFRKGAKISFTVRPKPHASIVLVKKMIIKGSIAFAIISFIVLFPFFCD